MNLDNPLYERSLLVFSEQQLTALDQAHVLVAGVGGVGGFVCEALARAGVGRLTLIDHDRVSPSNINRQLVALHSTLSCLKVDVMKQRIADINPNCKVETRAVFLSPDDMPILLADDYSFVVDAIDSLNCKVALVETSIKMSIPIVSSMGAGRRVDPSKIKIADISKTHGCGLARVMRQRLKKAGIKKGLDVIFSEELPCAAGDFEEISGARGRVVNGTASYMPGIFGLMLAGLVIQKIAHAVEVKD